jgi:hypothetical protein
MAALASAVGASGHLLVFIYAWSNMAPGADPSVTSTSLSNTPSADSALPSAPSASGVASTATTTPAPVLAPVLAATTRSLAIRCAFTAAIT